MRRAVLAAAVMAVVIGVVPAAAAVAGLDRKAVQRKVAPALAAAYPGVPFGPVTCRALGKRSRPLVFTCTAPVGASKLTIDGRQSGSQKQAALEPREAVLAKTTLEAFVAEHASLSATVDCGADPWRVVAPNGTITCAVALADGARQQVELTVRDRAGAVTITKVT